MQVDEGSAQMWLALPGWYVHFVMDSLPCLITEISIERGLEQQACEPKRSTPGRHFATRVTNGRS
jgi:hypothetical protein